MLALTQGLMSVSSALAAVQTASILHFDGANGQTTFPDQNSEVVWTGFGVAQINTAQSRFGGASLLLNGSGDFLTTPWHPRFSILGDFTIECFIRRTAIGRDAILTNYSPASSGYLFDVGPLDELRLILGTGSFIICTSGAVTVPINAWTHVAGVKSGNTLRVFINGIQRGTLAITGVVADSTATPVHIGRHANDTTRDFGGHIDELRFSTVARYTADFTPPTAPFTWD